MNANNKDVVIVDDNKSRQQQNQNSTTGPQQLENEEEVVVAKIRNHEDEDDDDNIPMKNTTNDDNKHHLQEEKDESSSSPPPIVQRMRGEIFRDSLLRTLDRPFFQYLGITVLILVIADGALFFFLLMGWHTLCRPRTDCEPRNEWYNASIQILNILFTYMAVVSMPWRCTNFLHLTKWSCPIRDNSNGNNLYGLPDKELWFHIPKKRRLGITIILLWNCLFQFINQVTRIIYYNYELQDTSPGNIWTNVFFVASFACAGIGGAWMAYESKLLRDNQPNKFGPGPIDSLKNALQQFRNKGSSSPDTQQKEKKDAEKDDDEAAAAAVAAVDESFRDYVDPTRESLRRSVLRIEDRASLRMWAM